MRGKIGGRVVFSARLSSALAWSVAVNGPDGRVVTRGSGVGTAVEWSWDSTGFAPGRYTWTMRAGSSVLPAGGVVGGSPPPPPPPSSPPPPVSPLVKGLTVSPAVLSPNGDGFGDTATIAYTLAARSTVTAAVVDAVGAPVATLFRVQKQSARAISFVVSPGDLPDGRYALVISAQADDGRSGTATAPFVIDRILSAVTATPAAVLPGGTVTAAFTLAGDAQVAVTVLGPDGSIVATLFDGFVGAGTFSYAWNGLLADGHAGACGPLPGAGHGDRRAGHGDADGRLRHRLGSALAPPWWPHNLSPPGAFGPVPPVFHGSGNCVTCL